MSHDVPASACLNCGIINDACTNLDEDARPDPGDFTICFKCGHLMVFADDLSLRKPTDAEMLIIAGNKQLIAAQRARDLYWKEHKSDD